MFRYCFFYLIWFHELLLSAFCNAFDRLLWRRWFDRMITIHPRGWGVLPEKAWFGYPFITDFGAERFRCASEKRRRIATSRWVVFSRRRLARSIKMILQRYRMKRPEYGLYNASWQLILKPFLYFNYICLNGQFIFNFCMSCLSQDIIALQNIILADEESVWPITALVGNTGWTV